jgi:hypothetical protein
MARWQPIPLPDTVQHITAFGVDVRRRLLFVADAGDARRSTTLHAFDAFGAAQCTDRITLPMVERRCEYNSRGARSREKQQAPQTVTALVPFPDCLVLGVEVLAFGTSDRSYAYCRVARLPLRGRAATFEALAAALPRWPSALFALVDAYLPLLAPEAVLETLAGEQRYVHDRARHDRARDALLMSRRAHGARSVVADNVCLRQIDRIHALDPAAPERGLVCSSASGDDVDLVYWDAFIMRWVCVHHTDMLLPTAAFAAPLAADAELSLFAVAGVAHLRRTDATFAAGGSRLAIRDAPHRPPAHSQPAMASMRCAQTLRSRLLAVIGCDVVSDAQHPYADVRPRPCAPPTCCTCTRAPPTAPRRRAFWRGSRCRMSVRCLRCGAGNRTTAGSAGASRSRASVRCESLATPTPRRSGSPTATRCLRCGSTVCRAQTIRRMSGARTTSVGTSKRSALRSATARVSARVARTVRTCGRSRDRTPSSTRTGVRAQRAFRCDTHATHATRRARARAGARSR